MSIKQAIDGHVKVGVPLLYAFFISCGVFAAIASGVIEFQIFKQFFESNNSIDDAYIIIVPLSMVIIFEITKIYLVFYREQLEALNVDKKKKWIAGYFRYLLIFLSILSTLIFSIDTLKSPEKAVVIDAELKKIQATYDKRVEDDQKMLEGIRDEMKVQMKQGGPGDIFERLKTEEADYKSKVEASELARDEAVAGVKSTYENHTSVDNKMISSFLSTISLMVSGSNEYSRFSYYLFVVSLSLLLSISLEVVIVMVVYVIYHHHPNVLDFEDTSRDHINIIPALKYFLFAVLFLAVYKIFIENNGKEYVPISMFVVGAILYYVSRRFISVKDAHISQENQDGLSVQSYFAPAVVAALVPLAVGFIAAFLLGETGATRDLGSGEAIGAALATAFFGDKLGQAVQEATA